MRSKGPGYFKNNNNNKKHFLGHTHICLLANHGKPHFQVAVLLPLHAHLHIHKSSTQETSFTVAQLDKQLGNKVYYFIITEEVAWWLNTSLKNYQ